MKKIKNILKNIVASIWNLYAYPSVFIHELSHVIALYLVGCYIKKFELEVYKNLNFKLSIYNKREFTKRKLFVVNYAPVFAFVLIGILAIFSNVFLVIFAYEVTNLTKGRTLPSKIDINTYKEYCKVLDEYCLNIDE